MLRARYDAEVRYSDAQLERVLEAFDAASAGRPSLVVVTSDHGEGLEDHGWPNHNRSVYEEEVRVPLILRWEGRIPAGRRIPGPAHLVDLAPTLLGLLGAEAEAAFDGDDLSDALTGSGRLDPERPLYDLARDPAERNNLPAAQPATAEALAARSAQWRREQAARAIARDDDVPPVLREGLRALGYVE